MQRKDAETVQVEYLSDDAIEEAAASLLVEFGRRNNCPITEPPVPIDDIVMHLGLRCDLDDLNAKFGYQDTLGALWIESQHIFIDESLDPYVHPHKEGRYHFTIGHEVGHWRLHRRYFNPGQLSLLNTEEQPSIICRKSIAKERIEVQADLYSSYLLMPSELVHKAWFNQFGHHEPLTRGRCHQWRSQVPGIELPLEEIQSMLIAGFASQFKVSNQAMRIRLEKMGLIPSLPRASGF